MNTTLASLTMLIALAVTGAAQTTLDTIINKIAAQYDTIATFSASATMVDCS